MNDPKRKRIQFSHPRGMGETDKGITRYDGYERHRDTRPGRFAVTGDFIKLPDASTTPTNDSNR